MEANVPILNEVTEDTKFLVNQGGLMRQIHADDALPAIPKGVAVPDAAGEAPTAEEFKALLDSLRNAGIIAVD